MISLSRILVGQEEQHRKYFGKIRYMNQPELCGQLIEGEEHTKTMEAEIRGASMESVCTHT